MLLNKFSYAFCAVSVAFQIAPGRLQIKAGNVSLQMVNVHFLTQICSLPGVSWEATVN